MKIGNPISPHNMELIQEKSLTHAKVFTYFAFKELFQIYGFKVENLVGGGYYPFPVKFLSKIMANIDPKHAHFITMKVRKDE